MKTYETIGETMESFVHESGLPVYILKKKGFGKSYALFATKFGSVHNSFVADNVKIKVPDGIAHFLEHKLFEEEEGNVFEKFSALGASANAYTSFDMTGYLFSATDHFYEALDVLLRFVQNPYFTEENVEKEKGIIGQEIDMYRDDPAWRCFFGMIECMYKEHPVRYDIAGSVASIAKIDKTLLYQCYNAFYAPNNMVLFVAGDLEEDKVRKIVDDAIKTTRTPEVSFALPEEPHEVVKSECEAHFMVSKPMFTLGFKEVPMDNPIYADAVYAVLGALLFGKSMPLYKKLYDAKLVGDSYDYGYTAGTGYAFMQLEGESDDPRSVREAVLQEIADKRKNGIGEAEFQRIKRSIEGKALRALDDVEGTGNSFVPAYFRGGDWLTYCDTVRALRLEDVMAVLQNGLEEEKAVLSMVLPKERG